MAFMDMFQQDRYGINSFTAEVDSPDGMGMFGNEPQANWMNGLESALAPQQEQAPMFPNILNQQHTQMMPGNNNPSLPQPYTQPAPGQTKPIEVDEIEMAGSDMSSMFGPSTGGGNRAARIGNAAGGIANLITSRYGFKFR